MRIKRPSHLFSVFIFLVLFVTSIPASALTVDNMRFGVHPDKVRLVLDMDEAVDFRVFTLASPWRLAIDLPEFTWQAGIVKAPLRSHVKNIRQGILQPGIARIVLDLDTPIDVRTAFFLPKDGAKPNRLVIDFSKGTPDIFAAQKDRILGKLTVNNEASTPQAQTKTAVTHFAPSSTPPPSRALSGTVVPGMVMPQKKPFSQSTVTAPHTTAPKTATTPLKWVKPTIVIDPGHGGVDPGAVGNGHLLEKHITLSMAKELKRQLEATGRYIVKLTRTNDKYMRLYQRVNFAHKHKSDLFISLHADSIGKKAVRGASIYTLSEKASDEQTERLAMQENRADLIAGVDLSAEDETVVNILVDLAMRDTMNQSKFFANTIVSHLDSHKIRTLENPHRYAGFAVLKAADIPSVLIEMGFMSNSAEAVILASPTFQKKLARAVTSSIDAYFNKVGTE